DRPRGYVQLPDEVTKGETVADNCTVCSVGHAALMSQPLAARESEINAAFSTMSNRRAGALLVVASPLFVTRADHLVALAASHALPAICCRREWADRGALRTSGPATNERYGHMGISTGKMLNGAKPADLPVIQPTKFELVINLKTARALGLEVPPKLLALAD